MYLGQSVCFPCKCICKAFPAYRSCSFLTYELRVYTIKYAKYKVSNVWKLLTCSDIFLYTLSTLNILNIKYISKQWLKTTHLLRHLSDFRLAPHWQSGVLCRATTTLLWHGIRAESNRTVGSRTWLCGAQVCNIHVAQGGRRVSMMLMEHAVFHLGKASCGSSLALRGCH